MLVELLLSLVVIILLGGMILWGWMPMRPPHYPRSAGWRTTAERAALLLAAGIVLCPTVVWRPFLLR